MWMYLGSSCPDRPFSAELGDTEINTRVRGVLAHGAYLNLGSGPIPLREGVDSPSVSSLGLSFDCMCQFLLLPYVCKCARSRVHTQRPEGVTLPEDVVGREANLVYSKQMQAWRQRRRDWSAAWAAARARGQETPSEPESSGGDNEEDDKDGEEGEVTPPPHSPLPEDLPSLGDLFSWQVGISVSMCRPKWPRTETGSSTGPSPQPRLALVSPDL
jgi:hypothetical protein